MAQHLAAYCFTAAAFFIIDIIWLGFVATRFYTDRLGHLLLEQPNWGAAFVFYALYVAGIVIFAVAPALREESAGHALVFGALFGFFAYATYDMTNYATLRDWPLAVSLVDMAWGTALTGVSALLGYFGTRLLMSV